MPCSPLSDDIQSFISRQPLFEGMKPEGFARIVSGARKIGAARGEFVFRINDACTGLYLVMHGQIKLYFSSLQGNEKILEIPKPGHTFGESTLLQGKNHQFHAQSLSDCLIVHIAKAVFLDELEKSPSLARRLIHSLSQSVISLTHDVESYSLDSGRQRVINYLVREALRAKTADLAVLGDRVKCSTPEDGQNALTLTLPTSKNAIASLLNLTQESFSRMLHDLSESGLLTVSSRNVHIKDLDRFRQYALHPGLPPVPSLPDLPSWIKEAAHSRLGRGTQLEHRI